MSKAETVIAAKEVATTLGVGRAMLNRYAATLENLIGEKVPISGRDGRQFSEEQVSVLVRAKGLVEDNHGLSVEAALRAALAMDSSGAEMTLAGPQRDKEPQDTRALVEALREALTAPLLEELRELRRSNERLLERLERLEARELPNSSSSAGRVESDAPQHGPLVRVALWLEQRLRRL